MKKLLIVLTFILLPFQSQAAGVYDGIWQFPFGIFATVNQNGSSLAVIILQDTIWEAQLGTLVGNEATITTVYGYVSATIEVVFTSATTATVTIIRVAGLLLYKRPNRGVFVSSRNSAYWY